MKGLILSMCAKTVHCDWTEMRHCTLGCLSETDECSGHPTECHTE